MRSNSFFCAEGWRVASNSSMRRTLSTGRTCPATTFSVIFRKQLGERFNKKRRPGVRLRDQIRDQGRELSLATGVAKRRNVGPRAPVHDPHRGLVLVSLRFNFHDVIPVRIFAVPYGKSASVLPQRRSRRETQLSHNNPCENVSQETYIRPAKARPHIQRTGRNSDVMLTRQKLKLRMVPRKNADGRYEYRCLDGQFQGTEMIGGRRSGDVAPWWESRLGARNASASSIGRIQFRSGRGGQFPPEQLRCIGGRFGIH